MAIVLLSYKWYWYFKLASVWLSRFFNVGPKLFRFLAKSQYRIISANIVSAETILFWKCKIWKFSYSFRIMAIFYFINWIVASETIKGGKLFKGENYSRKYGMLGICYMVFKRGNYWRKYGRLEQLEFKLEKIGYLDWGLGQVLYYQMGV